MTSILDRWNQLSDELAVQEVLPCNGSRAWAKTLSATRPCAVAETLFRSADEVWRALRLEDWQEAFTSHPRLGESHARVADVRSLQWSAEEQSASGDVQMVREALAEGNRLYEARFGRVFLVCATGKSAAEMLAILRARLGNDAETELREAAEQQRRITQLRLRKWLGLPPACCEDV